MAVALLLLALAPVVIIASYIYFRDKYEKEPIQLLLLSLLAGSLIVIPIVFAERFMTYLGNGFEGVLLGGWNAFMVAALCEEVFKFSALYLLIWKNKAFNEKFDGIVYATFISLGFAGIENVLYVFGNGINTGLTRAITAVPAHAIFGISMGFFFGLAKFYPKKRNYYLKISFLLPFLLHGIYDFILMAGLTYLLLLFIPFLVYLWIFGFKKMKNLNNRSFYRNDLELDLDLSKVEEFKRHEEQAPKK